MTNRDAARLLVRQASRTLEEAAQNLERREWNLAVRRAQETLELAMKAYIAFMGLDYPKQHDPSAVFRRAAEKGGHFDEGEVDRLCTLSQWLAEERAPVFYAEREATEGEARRAEAGALSVLGKIKAIVGS